jgi:hypothetical protein
LPPDPGGPVAPVPREPLVEPCPFPQRLIQAHQEVSNHTVGTVGLKELLEVAKLLDDQIRAELPRGVQDRLRDRARLRWLALGDEHSDEYELPESAAARPVAWAKLDDALGLALRFDQVAKLA